MKHDLKCHQAELGLVAEKAAAFLAPFKQKRLDAPGRRQDGRTLAIVRRPIPPEVTEIKRRGTRVLLGEEPGAEETKDRCAALLTAARPSRSRTTTTTRRPMGAGRGQGHCG